MPRVAHADAAAATPACPHADCYGAVSYVELLVSIGLGGIPKAYRSAASTPRVVAMALQRLASEEPAFAREFAVAVCCHDGRANGKLMGAVLTHYLECSDLPMLLLECASGEIAACVAVQRSAPMAPPALKRSAVRAQGPGAAAADPSPCPLELLAGAAARALALEARRRARQVDNVAAGPSAARAQAAQRRSEQDAKRGARRHARST